MKIAFVTNLYEPFQRGGAEIVVKRSVEAAKAAGHEVVLFTARPWRGGGRLRAKTEPTAGIPVTYFYPANLYFYADDYRMPWLLRAFWHALDIVNGHSAWVFYRFLRREKPDVVITHNLMGLGFLLPAIIRRQRVKHIHVAHDIQLAVRSGLMFYGREHRFDTDGLLARAYQAVVRRMFGSPDVVVSPSRFLLDFYARQGYFPKSKQIVLPNPIDPSFYRANDSADAEAAPPVIPAPTGPLRLLFVGQLAEHKGLRVLMAAFDSAARALPGQLRLDIIGDGALAEVVKAWAGGRAEISCHGRLNSEDVRKACDRADLLVMPTITYENSPTVIFEALAAGLPVCVSRIGGAAEAVKEGENGFIVAPNDVAALSAAIMRAYSLRQRWPQFRSAARASVSGLDSAAYIRKLLSL